MELSLFYNGGNFYEGDLVRVKFWSNEDCKLVTGRLHKICSDCITIDYSREYHKRTVCIEFDTITNIELVKGRL